MTYNPLKVVDIIHNGHMKYKVIAARYIFNIPDELDDQSVADSMSQLCSDACTGIDEMAKQLEVSGGWMELRRVQL